MICLGHNRTPWRGCLPGQNEVRQPQTSPCVCLCVLPLPLKVWRATSILPNHVRLPRRLLLAVLTAAAGGGEAGATEAALVGVASALGLDWGGALGLWMW